MKKEPNYKVRFIILIAAFIVVVIFSFAVGRYPVYPGELFKVLGLSVRNIFAPVFGYAKADLPAPAATVLFNIRFPRAAAAMLIGASLSLAGISYQGMLRNPMVSPDILGASTGAGFGASLAIVLGAGYITIILSSFFMGLAAVMLAYLMSRLSRTNPTLAIVLAGIMVSSLFSAGTSMVKLMADTNTRLPQITYWLMGSLSSIRPEDVAFIVWPIVSGIIPLILIRWKMNLLAVGEEDARTMGINTNRLRAVIIICATLITAASVSVSGMIGWVGLVIPHFCRMIFGYDHRRTMPAAIILGAGFLTVVDDIARIITTAELPIGILTSFVGAPMFMYLLITGGTQRER